MPTGVQVGWESGRELACSAALTVPSCRDVGAHSSVDVSRVTTPGKHARNGNTQSTSRKTRSGRVMVPTVVSLLEFMHCVPWIQRRAGHKWNALGTESGDLLLFPC